MSSKVVSVVFHGKNFYAKGEYLSDGKVLIYKDSQFSRTIYNSLISGGRNERLYLENNNHLKNGILQKDYVFSSASSAASAVAGHNRNGLLEFKTIEGLTLGEYLNRFSNDDNDIIEIVSDADKDDEINESYYGDITDIPPEAKYKDGVRFFLRNEKAKKIAVMQSGDVCALPTCKHQLFKTKTGRVYLEAHHLIPISVCGDFSVNIDVPENIVCLCPSCHREIHHGSNSEQMVIELYEERKEALEKKNIKLRDGLKQLLSYYGIKKD